MDPKRVGNEYERTIAKKLSLWITNGESDDVFWRVIDSGARATTRKKMGKTTINDGDLCAVNPDYKWFTDKFYMDTKTYKSCNFYFINKKNKKSNSILNQWLKVCNDCPPEKIPMMFCHIRDRSSNPFIVVPSYFIFDCNKQIDIQMVSFKVEEKSVYTGKDFVMLDLEEFFDTQKAETINLLNM